MRTFLRRLAILNHLKQQGEAVSTDALIEHLQHTGHLESSGPKQHRSQQRLVQRDMQFLLGERDADGAPDNDFGLCVSAGQSKTLLWRLDPFQALSYEFERMPAYMALTLAITRKHLSQILPTDTQQELTRIFDQADQKLQQQERKLQPQHYHRLTRSVAFFQRGQSLQAPQFDTGTLDNIYRAILLGRRVEFDYQSATGPGHYDIHPHGVVFMLPKVYLLGIKHEDQVEARNFRSFLVHRMTQLSVSRYASSISDEFDLARYLQSGHMDVLIDEKDPSHHTLSLQIRPLARSNLIRDLHSSPISPDQQLVETEDGTWLLSASVRRTVQLRNWLLSLGGEARIVEPQIIRHDLLAMLERIRAQY
jgi:predicted DNA-binding transcriptional regulator YafY